MNQGEKFLLAIVLVGDDDVVEGPYYVREPFGREPEWGGGLGELRVGGVVEEGGVTSEQTKQSHATAICVEWRYGAS